MSRKVGIIIITQVKWVEISLLCALCIIVSMWVTNDQSQKSNVGFM